MSQDSYRVLGRRVAVRSTSGEFAAQVKRFLRSFPRASGNGRSPDVTLSFIVAPPPKRASIRPFHFVYQSYGQVGRTTSYFHLLRFLEWQLNVFVGENVRDNLLVHSGAIARDGAGIILPGPSAAGKSSLTLALLLQGYRYFSDELAVVKPSTGELHAFPKPLGLKDISAFPDLADRRDIWFGPEADGSGAVWYVHPEDVTPHAINGAVPIRYIIFPRYDPSATPQLESLSPGQAMQKLLENSVNFPRFGRDGLHLLADLVEDAQCFSLIANGLGATTGLINELTGS